MQKVANASLPEASTTLRQALGQQHLLLPVSCCWTSAPSGILGEYKILILT